MLWEFESPLRHHTPFNLLDMETLLYVCGFIIGVLGTSFLLYFLKTRKTLRLQHELIKIFTLKMIAEDLEEKVDKCKKSCEDENKSQEKEEE